MTPEEIEAFTTIIINGLKEVPPIEGSNNWIYTLSVLIPSLVLIGGWFKKAFVKAIVKAMSDAVEALVKKLIETHSEELDKLKKKHDKLSSKVDDNHESLLDKIGKTCP